MIESAASNTSSLVYVYADQAACFVSGHKKAPYEDRRALRQFWEESTTGLLASTPQDDTRGHVIVKVGQRV